MAHTFCPGRFEAFRALNSFHLGQFTLDVRADGEFEYDGVTMRYLGRDFPVPQLAGLLGKWYVPVADQESTYKPAASGIQVHAADAAHQNHTTPMAIETHYEEVEVGTLAQVAARRANPQATPPQPTTPRQRIAAPEPQSNRLPVENGDDRDVTPARMRAQGGGGGTPQQQASAQNQVRTASHQQAPQPQPQPPQMPAGYPPGMPYPGMQGYPGMPYPGMQGYPGYPGMPSMQQQLMAMGAYNRLPMADMEAVMRADAINNQVLAAALAVPPHKTDNFGGNRYDAIDGIAEGDAVGPGGKYRLVRYDGQQGDVVREIEDTGGASVGDEGSNVFGQSRGVNINIPPVAIDSRAKPIGGGPKAGGPSVILPPEVFTPQVLAPDGMPFQSMPMPMPPVMPVMPVMPPPQVGVTGAGPNRAVVATQVGPNPPQMRTARSTQVLAEGNVGISELHDNGATGDTAVVIAGEDLTDLLPGAAVAGPPTHLARRVAHEWLKENAKLQWASRAKKALLEFREQPDVLDAICKMDKPGVGKLIRDLLAKGVPDEASLTE